tara:strand:- start:3422 stop:4429 length:1008 start_codon:yes stop_codon:yes gene_type:complete
MDCKFIDFSKVSSKLWDKEVDKMEGHTHLVSSNSINYYSAFDKIFNKSFLIEFEKKIVGIVPLAINKNFKDYIYGFNYNYCPSPVFISGLKPSTRRKILKSLFAHIKNMNLNIKKLNLFTHPVFYSKNKFEINSKNQFELLEFTKNFSVINTLILDLKLDEEELLNNMSKYHKRNISRIKSSMTFNIYDNKKKSILEKKFKEFKNLHFESAGKKTRPDSTWDIMFQNIMNGSGVLFSSMVEKKDISFLYCGVFKDFAWGWSQVNKQGLEKKYMPRHFLEWKAIQYFKLRNFCYYELGENYRNKVKKFTKKEISIAEFKEKYGSPSYPKSSFQLKL